MGRWIRFLIAVAIGAAAAMFYGWKINPVRYSDTSLDALRIDFKIDYVLMVAEAYRAEGDIDLAARRLALISTDKPLKTVTNIIQAAKDSKDFLPTDLEMMQNLEEALQGWSPVPVKARP